MELRVGTMTDNKGAEASGRSETPERTPYRQNGAKRLQGDGNNADSSDRNVSRRTLVFLKGPFIWQRIDYFKTPCCRLEDFNAQNRGKQRQDPQDQNTGHKNQKPR